MQTGIQHIMNEITLECCDSVVSSNVIMEKCQIIFVLDENDSISQVFQFG